MNSVNILDMNGQNMFVDLISYFKDNNKNYIFYTKNENVNDGLIKMYVAKENDGAYNWDEDPDIKTTTTSVGNKNVKKLVKNLDNHNSNQNT